MMNKSDHDRQPFNSWLGGNPPSGYFDASLGHDEKAFYDANGYLVLDRILTDAEVCAITSEATRIGRNANGEVEGIPPASAELSDAEVLQRILCIHFPHKISEVMLGALRHPAIVQALTTVIGPDVKAMQSMLFFKGAGKPGQAWHQDEDYIPTRDRSLTGAWIALDDATVENGCLWVIPGSHRPGVLWEMQWHGDQRFDCSLESRGFPYSEADEVPVEVKRGSVVIFNGYTLHRSLPNRATAGFRRALVNHYMSAASLLPWRIKPGTPVARSDTRDIVMVSGEDPYGWNPLTEEARAFVRPAGEGGCVDGVTKEKRVYTR